MPAVSWSELLIGFECSSVEGPYEMKGHVCRETGAVHCVSEDEDMDTDLPDDLATSERYIALPGRRELDLGRSLALSFIEEASPADLDVAAECFRRRGAYAKFKGLLERRGLLPQWYAFESAAIESALRQWCRDNGLDVVG